MGQCKLKFSYYDVISETYRPKCNVNNVKYAFTYRYPLHICGRQFFRIDLTEVSKLFDKLTI